MYSDAYLYLSISIYLYINIYIYIYIYIYVNIYTYLHFYIYVYMYINYCHHFHYYCYVYTYIHMHTYVDLFQSCLDWFDVPDPAYKVCPPHSENSQTESCTERYSSQFQNNCLAKMWSGSEESSYLRLIDFLYHSILGTRVTKKEEMCYSRASTGSACPTLRTRSRPYVKRFLLVLTKMMLCGKLHFEKVLD